MSKTIAPERIPAFLVLASANAGALTANVRFRNQGIGTTQSVFVFALAPADAVKDAVIDKASPMRWSFASGSQGPVGAVRSRAALR